MRQQEEKLRAKYGDLKPKKKLIHKVRAGKPRRRKRHRTHSSRCSTPRMRRAYSFSRSFTLTHRNRALHSHAHEQDVKYFDSADYSLQQVRAVCALAVRAADTRPRASHLFFFFRSPPTRSFPFLFARAARQGAPQGRGGRAHATRKDGQLAAEV